jgi:peptide deformylase
MMAIRDLRFYPDPILRQHCRKVEVFDQELQDFLDDLAESMYAHRGVGLAAPQVGDTRRAAVVDVGQQEDAPVLVELVNPQVVESSEELSEYEEGCLSFPGEAELVTRPARVTVRALDRKGNPFEIKAEGLLARDRSPRRHSLHRSHFPAQARPGRAPHEEEVAGSGLLIPCRSATSSSARLVFVSRC